MEDVKKSKGGRPKSENPKNINVGFKCDAKELARLDDLAAAYGVTVGEYCRLKALGGKMPKPPVPLINVEKYQELSRLAGNFNQLLKAIHAEKITCVDEFLIEDIAKNIEGLRKDLLGMNDDDTEY